MKGGSKGWRKKGSEEEKEEGREQEEGSWEGRKKFTLTPYAISVEKWNQFVSKITIKIFSIFTHFIMTKK